MPKCFVVTGSHGDKRSVLVPDSGFYYHYKHDPKGPIDSCAHEVLCVARHTKVDQCLVISRPLYREAKVYREGKMADAFPLEMWMGEVEVLGDCVPQFTKITSERIITELKRRREIMYNDGRRLAEYY